MGATTAIFSVVNAVMLQARALAQDLAREFPEDTFVQFIYLSADASGPVLIEHW